MNKDKWYIIAVIVIIIAVGGWLMAKKTAKSPAAPAQQSPADETPISDKQKTATNKTSPTWEGTLKLSNNPQKGNLMLVTKERNIYLKTSRDFSALIGKEVIVSYEGTLESFQLGDIAEK